MLIVKRLHLMLGVEGDIDLLVHGLFQALQHRGEELPQVLGSHADGWVVRHHLADEADQVACLRGGHGVIGTLDDGSKSGQDYFLTTGRDFQF